MNSSAEFKCENPLLIVISGPSGVGKSTLLSALLARFNQQYPGCLNVSISHTTRECRQSEKNGENYFFVSKEDFLSMVEKHKFLEYTTIYDNYYGTSQQIIDEKFKDGYSIILEIDVKGAEFIRSNDVPSCSIFIAPENMQVLEQRIVNRGREKDEELAKRREYWQYELEQRKFYDYVVYNLDMQDALEKLYKIVVAKIKPKLVAS